MPGQPPDQARRPITGSGDIPDAVPEQVRTATAKLVSEVRSDVTTIELLGTDTWVTIVRRDNSRLSARERADILSLVQQATPNNGAIRAVETGGEYIVRIDYTGGGSPSFD